MGIIGKLGKPDWLGEMQTVAAVGVVGTVVVTGMTVVQALVSEQGVTVAVPADWLGESVGQGAKLPAEVSVAADAAVEVAVTGPRPYQLIAYLLTGLPTMLVVLGLLAMLWYILRGARRGDPFTARTVRQLRILAGATIVGGTVAGLVETFAGLALVQSITHTGEFYAAWKVPVPWLLAGFGLLAVAELVKRGTAMRAELETVI